MPLYDILNEFQKGHSHMAVVVKHKNDGGETVGNVSIFEKMHPNRRPTYADRQGISSDENAP